MRNQQLRISILLLCCLESNSCAPLSNFIIILCIMSIKGKIARFYNDKPKVVNLFWILAQVQFTGNSSKQIVSLLFVIAGLCVLFLAPGYTAMGIVMKIYDVFVIALVSFMFIYKKCNKKMVLFQIYMLCLVRNQ